MRPDRGTKPILSTLDQAGTIGMRIVLRSCSAIGRTASKSVPSTTSTDSVSAAANQSTIFKTVAFVRSATLPTRHLRSSWPVEGMPVKTMRSEFG
jgi:hypothetical protein